MPSCFLLSIAPACGVRVLQPVNPAYFQRETPPNVQDVRARSEVDAASEKANALRRPRRRYFCNTRPKSADAHLLRGKRIAT
jgi:hypothetical protein